MRGQTTLEYIILIGIVVMAIFFMSPAFKRGIQSLVKVTADQIGNQAAADQEITRPTDPSKLKEYFNDPNTDDGGFMAKSTAQSRIKGNKRTVERQYMTNTIFDEESSTYSNTVTDMGIRRP